MSWTYLSINKCMLYDHSAAAREAIDDHWRDCRRVAKDQRIKLYPGNMRV